MAVAADSGGAGGGKLGGGGTIIASFMNAAPKTAVVNPRDGSTGIALKDLKPGNPPENIS